MQGSRADLFNYTVSAGRGYSVKAALFDAGWRRARSSGLVACRREIVTMSRTAGCRARLSGGRGTR
jgi:hypothetical protein